MMYSRSIQKEKKPKLTSDEKFFCSLEASELTFTSTFWSFCNLDKRLALVADTPQNTPRIKEMYQDGKCH